MKKIINVSDITGYLFCPRKIWLKLVKGIKEKPTKQMMSGFLKHKVFDYFNKNEAAIVSNIKENLNEEQIKDFYSRNLAEIIRQVALDYRNIFEKFEINLGEFSSEVHEFMGREIQLRAESIKSFLERKIFGRQLWQELKPKYLTEFEIISDGLGLKGRVDRVKFDSEILPYELKTRAEIFEADKIQLAAYSLLLEGKYERKINSGIIESGKEKEEIEITEEMKARVLEIAEILRNLDKEPALLNNFSKCQSCRLRKECFEI